MQEPKPQGKNNTNKLVLPIALTVVTAFGGAVGTTLYKHELSILANARHIERLKIKDYRQHKTVLRNRVIFLADATDTLEAVLEIDEDVFGPNSRLIVKARRSQLQHAREQLDNYVEENKHGGRDD